MTTLYYGQIIIGPSGSGKTSYCSIIQKMAQTLKRNIHIINLDPASEYLPYTARSDIKTLITLEDVMEAYKLGPNGGLIYCMEYLLENIDWLEDELNSICEDDYVIFDLPGQIELYSHLLIIPKIISKLKKIGFSLCSVCMIDSTFLYDDMKFVSGVLAALNFSISLDLPALNVLTKCDLVADKGFLDRKIGKVRETCFDYEMEAFLEKEGHEGTEDDQDIGFFEKKYDSLKMKIEKIIDEFGLVSFLKLDISDEQTIYDLIYEADYCIQYGENLEPEEKNVKGAENYLNNLNN